MDFILQNNDMIRSMSFGSFQLTRHSKVYENPATFNVSKIDQNEAIDLSLWYDCEVSGGLSKKETDDVIQEFYTKLAHKYLDLPIWSNLDREHLFLYIAHYKKSINKVADLSGLIKAIQHRKNSKKKSSRKTTPRKAAARLVIEPAPPPKMAEAVELGIQNAAAMIPFYEMLYRLEQQQGTGEPVRVLHFGDSHTASDDWAGEMRARFQKRFGDGGPGFTQAGRPFAGFRRYD